MSDFYNECGVITIFPMGLECVSIDPTTENPSSGILSINITGGTSPYSVYWELPDGGIYYGRTLYNKSEGEYKVTVIDKYGDYTATTICVLELQKDCNFNYNINETPYPSPTPTPTPSITPTITPTQTVTPTPTPSTECGDCCLVRLNWTWTLEDACNFTNINTSYFYGPQILEDQDILYSNIDCSTPAEGIKYIIQGSNIFRLDNVGTLFIETCP